MQVPTALLAIEMERLQEEGYAESVGAVPYTILKELYPEILVIPDDIRGYLTAAPRPPVVERFVYQIAEQGKRKWSRPWVRNPDRDDIRVFSEKEHCFDSAAQVWSLFERSVSAIQAPLYYPRVDKAYRAISDLHKSFQPLMPNPLGFASQNYENRCLIAITLCAFEPDLIEDEERLHDFYGGLHGLLLDIHEIMQDMDELASDVREEWTKAIASQS